MSRTNSSRRYQQYCSSWALWSFFILSFVVVTASATLSLPRMSDERKLSPLNHVEEEEDDKYDRKTTTAASSSPPWIGDDEEQKKAIRTAQLMAELESLMKSRKLGREIEKQHEAAARRRNSNHGEL
mmetsp:Transcript_42857/g.48696  ORF Transcript_42857/g.48696 Transcript_42857/m.48696 type:complete len:127 (-) Transcript_42857:334-714(-)|eukprot:CAMPEP_0194135336 /NCGR_PEP_ID=MMETSP0152-20130528/5437_1 /TAXON_ID=1049557 /ORGANISM="Thalassiothrix antarctica, Strain L6-D1" /LENGTH=126 /DNA_ID=CAMNT_0038831539 /DNA_START=93 /DNA_END=473 /DNA_ORIENTATION=-